VYVCLSILACVCVWHSYLHGALFELVAAGGVESCGLLEDELACCLEGLWTRDTETTQR